MADQLREGAPRLDAPREPVERRAQAADEERVQGVLRGVAVAERRGCLEQEREHRERALIGALEVVQDDDRGAHGGDVAEQPADRVEEADALLERFGLRDRALGRRPRKFEGRVDLPLTVEVPEAVAAVVAGEVARLDRRGRADLAQKAQRLLDDLGERPERAPRLAATVEHDAALEPDPHAELPEDAGLPHAARALEPGDALALRSRFAIERREAPQLRFAADTR